MQEMEWTKAMDDRKDDKSKWNKDRIGWWLPY